MYVWIWRHLPGALGWKVLQIGLLVAVVSALLLFIIFPWLEPKLPINKATVN